MIELDDFEQVRPITLRDEQAMSFTACGCAIHTRDPGCCLNTCLDTAGPGAVDLLSGLAMAMPDPHPFSAVSGYADRKGSGRGPLDATSGADGSPGEELDDVEAAFAAALTSRRPGVVDARTTRWAVPHDSPRPTG